MFYKKPTSVLSLRLCLFAFIVLFLYYPSTAQTFKWVEAVSGPNISWGLDALHQKNKKWVYFTNGMSYTIKFHGKVIKPKATYGPGYSTVFCYDTAGHFAWYKNLDTLTFNPHLPYEDNEESLYFINNFANVINITKLTLGGKVAWVKKLIDKAAYPGNENAQILVDNNKNIILTFDMRQGDSIVIGTQKIHFLLPGYNFVTVKFDSTGKLQWCKTLFTHFNPNTIVHFALDTLGNLCGWGDIQDFGGQETLTIDNKTYKAGKFLLKADGNTGHVNWFKYFSGLYYYNYYGKLMSSTKHINTDAEGNIYVSGSLQGKSNVGGITIDGGNFYSPFLAKFDSTGKTIWVKAFQNDQYCPGLYDDNSLSLDGMGNVILAGNFMGHIVTGNDTLSSSGDAVPQDMATYLIKLDTSGGLLWSKAITYRYLNQSYPYASLVPEISADKNDVYFAGVYTSDVRVDTFKFSSSNYSFINGKLTIPSIPKDSIYATHQTCTDSPFYFHLFYNHKPDSVRWSFGDGGSSKLVQPTHVYSKSGTYTVKLTEYLNGNAVSYSRTVTYFDIPQKFLPGDTVLCPGVKLKVSPSTNFQASYRWNDGDTNAVKTVNKGGNYILDITAKGCSRKDSILIKYDDRSFTLGHDTILCKGATLTLQGPAWPKAAYLWNDGNTNTGKTISSAGQYALTVSDSVCSFKDSIKITYDLFPDKIGPADTVVCKNEPINVKLLGFQGQVKWQDGNTSHVYQIRAGGTYIVMLSNFCSTKTYTIQARDSNCNCSLFAPNAFSPNTDKTNDGYFVRFSCAAELYELQIYNRWGEELYSSTNTNDSWDGFYKGSPCPEGVYFYKIYYKFPHDGEQMQTGTITIIR